MVLGLTYANYTIIPHSLFLNGVLEVNCNKKDINFINMSDKYQNHITCITLGVTKCRTSTKNVNTFICVTQ